MYLLFYEEIFIILCEILIKFIIERMENIEHNHEWYEDNDPEIDFNELNKTANITRYANTVKLKFILKNRTTTILIIQTTNLPSPTKS